MTMVVDNGNGGLDFTWDLSVLNDLNPVSMSPTTIVFQFVGDNDGVPVHVTLTFTGSFAGLDTDQITGTITGFHNVTDDGEDLTISDFSMPVSTFSSFVDANDAKGLMAAWFAGDDTFTGGTNDDFVRGYGGNDTMIGNAGNDSFGGDGGNDGLYGGDGNDNLAGLAGNDVLYGGAQDDILFGGTGDDAVYGGDGNDLVGGGYGIANIASAPPATAWSFANNATTPGTDIVDGGAGFDEGIFFYLNQTGGYTVDISNPNIVSAVLYNGAAAGSVTGVEVMFATGALGDDTFTGGGFSDNISGSLGNDTVIGNAGNDTLIGDSGDDSLYGGAGNDGINGGTGVDTAY